MSSGATQKREEKSGKQDAARAAAEQSQLSGHSQALLGQTYAEQSSNLQPPSDFEAVQKRGLGSYPMASQVQMLRPGGESATSTDAGVREAASQGLTGGGGAMPHASTIQDAFGHHDIGGVSAHMDAPAQQASAAIGAEAYTVGDSVAFNSAAPSLHTTAHEAAHVIQQRGGVSVPGGVGAAGDSYEAHADQVADAVVSGQSAEPLLDSSPVGAGGGAVQEKPVQRAGAPPTTPPSPSAYPYAHEEPAYASALATAGVGDSTEIARLVYEGLAAGGDEAKYDAAAQKVSVPVVPANQLVFWSGDGCESAAQASGGITLDTTEVGKLGKVFAFGDSRWQAKVPLWRAISRRFAEAAKGEIHAYLGFSTYDKVGGFNPNSVFVLAEKDKVDEMAADHPEYRLKFVYHWVAAVHDLENGKLGDDSSIGSHVEGLAETENETDSPELQSLYWITGQAGHVGFKFTTNWIETYEKDDGTRVVGHLRGV